LPGTVGHEPGGDRRELGFPDEADAPHHDLHETTFETCVRDR
jgi:hypothetical protein